MCDSVIIPNFDGILLKIWIKYIFYNLKQLGVTDLKYNCKVTHTFFKLIKLIFLINFHNLKCRKCTSNFIN